MAAILAPRGIHRDEHRGRHYSLVHDRVHSLAKRTTNRGAIWLYVSRLRQAKLVAASVADRRRPTSFSVWTKIHLRRRICRPSPCKRSWQRCVPCRGCAGFHAGIRVNTSTKNLLLRRWLRPICRVDNSLLPLSIEELDFFDAKPDDDILKLIKMVPFLRYLRFDACDVTDRHLSGLNQCTMLTTLRIRAQISATKAGRNRRIGIARRTLPFRPPRNHRSRHCGTHAAKMAPAIGFNRGSSECGTDRCPQAASQVGKTEMFNERMSGDDLRLLTHLPGLQAVTIRTYTPISEDTLTILRKRIRCVTILNRERVASPF